MHGVVAFDELVNVVYDYSNKVGVEIDVEYGQTDSDVKHRGSQ